MTTPFERSMGGNTVGIFDKDREESEVENPGVKEDAYWHFWLAYHTDFSGMVAFPTEIEALRYAVANHMSVKKVYGGFDLRTDRYEGP